jgi:multiple antibiotic resistance protein
MTALLSLRAEYAVQNIIAAIFINMVLVYIVLKSSSFLEKKIGSGGLAVLRKVFGVILLAIAVKLFRSNLGV